MSVIQDPHTNFKCYSGSLRSEHRARCTRLYSKSKGSSKSFAVALTVYHLSAAAGPWPVGGSSPPTACACASLEARGAAYAFPLATGVGLEDR